MTRWGKKGWSCIDLGAKKDFGAAYVECLNVACTEHPGDQAQPVLVHEKLILLDQLDLLYDKVSGVRYLAGF